ncbi:MAG TPA: tetratricopeptide repeat protein [Pyrinomonadaceae bacterium]|nr:tetratricopeptide repeat protein [Pyrinomonadaceae bacterium]
MELERTESTQMSIGLSAEEEVSAGCLRSKGLAEAGDYDGARNVLMPFWSHLGDRPALEGLSGLSKAELLLRVGSLTGWLGRSRQLDGAQELAKNLISESAKIFETQRAPEKWAEAQVELAICYWREGGHDEARVVLNDVINKFNESDSEQYLRALLNLALVERSSLRYQDALRIHREAAPLFQRSANHALRGKFHNEYATALKGIGLEKNWEEYIDQALVEYAAASFHLEQAGHIRFQGAVENNLANLFVRIGKFDEAHKYLDRASRTFSLLKDKGSFAQVNDSRAKAFIAQGRYAEAERIARASVHSLEKGDELALLAEALTTHGVALARTGDFVHARRDFQKGIDVAARAGSPESGGVAALCMVEELSNLPISERITYYHQAETLLVNSQNAGIDDRLNQCARMLLGMQWASVSEAVGANGSYGAPAGADATLSDLTLEQQVLRFEANLIKRALEASGGSVTRAARMLGTTHQGLAFILNGRQKDLLSARTPVRRRRRSIIRRR